MSQSRLAKFNNAENISLSLQSTDCIGSLNVGRHHVLVGSPDGLVVQSLSQATTLVARPAAALSIPPVPQHAIASEPLLAQAVAALQAHRSLEIIGPVGVGKSTFLRQLAHHSDVTTSQPDGILYFETIDLVADVIQTIGRTFYQLYPESYLTLEEWQVALQDCQALVLINAPEARNETLLELSEMLPQSTFVFVSEQPRLAQLLRNSPVTRTVVELTLQPLPLAQLVPRLEQVLDRSLSVTEAHLFAQLWPGFQGEAARLLQVAALLRESELRQSETATAVWTNILKSPVMGDRGQLIQVLTDHLLQSLDTPQRWILGLLTALDGVSLTLGQITQITGPQDPRSSLQKLQQLGLIQIVAQRYRVAPPMQRWLAKRFDAQPWMARGLTVMLAWVETQDAAAIQPEIPVLVAFLRWAVQEKRSDVVLPLARAIDATLILSQQWELWGRVLQWALQAAWQAADPVAEAWAWHQIGTRALLLEDITTAYDALQQALKLRQAQLPSNPELPDRQPVAVTRNNFDRVIQSTLPLNRKAEVVAEQKRQQSNGALLVISFVTFLLALLAGFAIKPWLSPPPGSNSPPSRQMR